MKSEDNLKYCIIMHFYICNIQHQQKRKVLSNNSMKNQDVKKIARRAYNKG